MRVEPRDVENSGCRLFLAVQEMPAAQHRIFMPYPQQPRHVGGKRLAVRRLRLRPVQPRDFVVLAVGVVIAALCATELDRKSTRLNSSHLVISYAVFCLKEKTSRHLTVIY